MHILNTGFGYYAVYDYLLFAFFVLLTIFLELFIFWVVYPILKKKPHYLFIVVVGANFLTGLIGYFIVIVGKI